jgi:hypothetical protein
MTENLTREQWASVLEDTDPATYGELVATLEDRELVSAESAALVEAGIEDGPLAETDDSGAFPVYGLEAPATPDEEGGEADHVETTPTPDADETTSADGRAALQDAVRWFHEQLDRTIVDHTDDGEHPERATTAREYWEDVRGLNEDTVDEKLLGWAPPDARDQLLDHLLRCDHDREDILASGLFTDDLDLLWRGRYVLPYFDEDDRVAYAISRVTGGAGGGAVGYDGHPQDVMSGKYAKLAHTKEYVDVDEPIYGLPSLEDGEDVIITEGILDAIAAHEAGYACLSPVTTQFKHRHREALLAILDERDIGTVYVLQDAEPPTSDLTEDADGWDALTIEQFGEGVKGGAKTAGYLAENGVDARLAELPRPGLDKVDLDDYLHGWADTLAPILATSVPPEQHPAYDPQQAAVEAASRERASAAERAGDGDTALFDLDLVDVAGVDEGYRGVNPLGHHGESETYYTVLNGGELGFDHKHKAAYNALTHLLVEAGERRASSPSGPVDDDELLAVWVHAKREGHLGADDPIPHAALQHLAVSEGLCDHDDLADGWRIPREAYNEALGILEDEYGVDPGRESISAGRTDSERDAEELKELDITLDREVAWRAAGAVAPSDVDADLAVPTDDDGSAWLCPRCGDEIGIVRAAAIDSGISRACSAALDDDEYDRAYEHARRGLDAPLPEYVSRETATERWDIVRGALRQLDFWHLDEDALNSEVTGRGDDVDGDARLTLDPAWRDSESGESVLVFPSGTVYEAHPDHEGVLDVLRLVGLDAGLIGWDEFTGEDYQLTGDTFRAVYDVARDYGAPLPRWEGTDAYHTAVLPPAEELVDEDVGDDDRLHAAYDAVGDLYTDAADKGEATLLRVLPGLGKTGQVFRNATEYPVLYTAGRKELMADAVDRAAENGASAYVLPVFAEEGPPTIVKDTAEAALREEGQRLLRDRWTLVERVEERLPDGEELCHPDEYESGEDEVNLDRESCPTANGKYGLDWWLAVHAARARGYRPQQIHENAAALFGADLPCTCDEGEEPGEATCDYTEAWEIATDPDAPIDVLVGHYTHAHVEGARTYSYRENGRTQKRPRVVALDEFPGEAFQRTFGEEYPDLAAWLAGALREDIDDRQDVLTKAADLWADETVSAWLSPDEVADEHDRIADALGAAHAGLDAVSSAEWLLEERRDACRDLGVEDALETLVDAHPELTDDTLEQVAGTISAAVVDDDNRGASASALNQLEELADHLHEARLADAGIEEGVEDALSATSHVDGALASLVTDALEGFRGADDTAKRRLDAARTALQGGPAGCEALAMHADDGYAHPLAHTLLYALLAPEDEDGVATVRTSNFTFGIEEDTRLTSVEYATSTVLADRNHHGAVVNHPPAFTAGGGDNPVVGLDATGREALWELAIGRDITGRDIHDNPRERREFLREVYGLQLVQTSPHANSYEGDPSGKNFDDDVELVREVAEQYGDTVDQDPAVLTTKVVENTLEDRLDGLASATGHYGDLKGSNALSDHRLAVLLGCQHYGDHVVERWAALAGEEATRTGHGMALDYSSRVANTVLAHMREDQVMQAALRFGRDSDGALVFCHTAALRDDLPVVADGEVVRTFSKQAQAIAKAACELARRRSFTAGDVHDRVKGHDPSRRTVRRVLSELAEFGYLEKTETPNGFANEYNVDDEPGAAEVDLPDLDTRAAQGDPGRNPLEVYYTWSVRVSPGDPRPADHRTVRRAKLPAPGGGGGGETASAPPG